MRETGEYGANATNKRGIVVDLDPANMRFRAEFEDEDGMVSAWIDVPARAGGSTKTFMMPDAGDEVWCALDAKGEDGCLIGVKYNAQNQPPFASNDDIGLVWPGGSVHINKGSGAVTINTNGPVNVTTIGDVKITAQAIELISSTLTHNGVNIGNDHKHKGVLVGGANTKEPLQ